MKISKIVLVGLVGLTSVLTSCRKDNLQDMQQSNNDYTSTMNTDEYGETSVGNDFDGERKIDSDNGENRDFPQPEFGVEPIQPDFGVDPIAGDPNTTRPLFMSKVKGIKYSAKYKDKFQDHYEMFEYTSQNVVTVTTYNMDGSVNQVHIGTLSEHTENNINGSNGLDYILNSDGSILRPGAILYERNI